MELIHNFTQSMDMNTQRTNRVVAVVACVSPRSKTGPPRSLSRMKNSTIWRVISEIAERSDMDARNRNAEAQGWCH